MKWLISHKILNQLINQSYFEFSDGSFIIDLINEYVSYISMIIEATEKVPQFDR